MDKVFIEGRSLLQVSTKYMNYCDPVHKKACDKMMKLELKQLVTAISIMEGIEHYRCSANTTIMVNFFFVVYI